MNESIDAQKFCKMPQIDIDNIYLGPKTILQHCSCPSPPLYLESEPFDEEYLNDSRYIYEKDKLKYMEEYNAIKQEEIKFECYNYQPQEIIENNFFSEEYREEIISDFSDGEDDNEDNYADDGEFELVRK
jgi:hypothetical protein